MEEARSSRVEDHHVEGEKYSNLKLAFSVALHSLLTACSPEEFASYFPFLKPFQLDALFKLYVQMVMSVQENLAEEFGDICEETRVSDALTDRFTFGRDLDETNLQRRSCAGKEMVIDGKQNELKYLKHTLQNVKEQNNTFAMKLRALKQSLENSDGAVSTDAILIKLRELNTRLGTAVSKEGRGSDG